MLRIVTVLMLMSLPAVARDNGHWDDQPAICVNGFKN
jgi:hypothetical protein